jgi:FixJ family two-component response regulator
MTIGTAKPTVCVVDDDPTTADAIRAALVPIGFAVICFDNSVDFLLSGTARSCDCLMTVAGGKELTVAELQATLREAGLTLPVMLIARTQAERLADNPRPPGVSGVIRKPISPSALLLGLRRALASRGQ